MRRSFLPWLRLPLAALFATSLAIGASVPAAFAAVQNRITTPVSGSAAVEVPNSVHPKVPLASDLGPTAGDTKLVGMTIRFNMTTAQEAALDQLLVDQQNPASPSYHQWLTPAQFGAQFGLSSADLAQVSAWLTSQGFTVTGVANGGTFVSFDGTVAQAEAAFATSIHNLSVDGETHYANITNPSVPGAFAGVVSAITGLHNFRAKPRMRINTARPQYTLPATGSHFLAPADIYTIYDVNPLLNAATPINGTGETIAVTGAIDLYNTGTTTTPVYADVVAFRSAAGLSTTNLPTTIHIGSDPGSGYNCDPDVVADCPSPNLDDLDEASIDVEWSGAMAPSATILFVNGVDPFNNAMTGAIDQDLAPIVTTSYGNCEAAQGANELNELNQLFKEANAQGQTVLSAVGDSGSTDCDGGLTAVEGLAVDFPASSPYITGLGGTELNDGDATGASQYWSGSNSATGGSVLSYIPESVWDEDSPTSGFSAGGGGISAFFTKPAWQVETGPPSLTTTVPPDASRDIPDLALDAANDHDSYIFCVTGSCQSGFLATSGLYAGQVYGLAGGTSFDSQIFGGMLALVEQKIGGRIGNANPTIYALGNNALYYNSTSSSVFHDVTTGSNDNPCVGGSIDCPNGGTIGFNAGVGYDLATGWGSVDLYNLASDWKLVTPLGLGSPPGPGISTTALTDSAASVAAGTNVMFTATVTGQNVTTESPLATTPGTATPTGTVQFLVNNAIVGSGTLNGSGVATYSFATSCAGIGQLVLSASYSGDTNYAGSKGPTLDALEAGAGGYPVNQSNGSVEVSPLIVTVSSAGSTCPDFTVTPANASISVASGGTIPAATITVAPVNSFSGTVVFSDSVTSTSGYLPIITFIPGSVAVTATSMPTTSVNLTGISAELRMPSLPGQKGPGTQSAPWYAVGSGATVACLLLLTLPRRRRLGGLLVLALSVAIALGAAGCGTNTVNAPASSTNPYAGVYVITITGTATVSGAVTSHSTTVTFDIN